jgi:hypothetical protein
VHLFSLLCRVDTSGIITTIAGTGKAGFDGDGDLATSAQLKNPVHATLDMKGDNLYIADFGNYRCGGTLDRRWYMMGFAAWVRWNTSAY